MDFWRIRKPILVLTVISLVFLAAGSVPPLRVPAAVKVFREPAEPHSQLPPAEPATYIKLEPLQTSLPAYGLAEFRVETDGAPANPFDPDQFDVEVRYTSPKGESVSAPAFWYQDFDPTSLQPVGQPGWRARFTPTEAGQWSAQAILAGQDLSSAPVKFTVRPDPRDPGFVRINQHNPRYLQFDNGAFFFPIGQNIAWPESLATAQSDYRHWFGRLSQNGGNAARVWMASWGFGIEWKDTGLGDYSNRLLQAWLLDQVFELARQDGIYIILTLLNHGAFSEEADPEWAYNPYNRVQGGPLSSPQDFVTDPDAQSYFQRRLRYIAARWGYSPNLMAWEWWNEVDWTPIRQSQLGPWMARMDAYLQRYDPNHHLITNSYTGSAPPTGWDLPGVDLIMQHDYSRSDPLQSFAADIQQVSAALPVRPALVEELGISSDGKEGPAQSEPIQLHNGLWAAAFNGYAGSAMYWWWDCYVDARNLWPVYKGISTFLSGEDLAQMKPGKARVSSSAAQALTLQSPTRALVWVRSNAYNVSTSLNSYAMAVRYGMPSINWTYRLPVLRGLNLTIDGLVNGAYKADWFDPITGHWLGNNKVTVKDHTITLPISSLQRDVAVRLSRQD
jgi:hypothetical protein